MKKIFKLEILKTNESLTEGEQNTFRLKFKPFLLYKGVISLCLEKKRLYVEYNPIFLDIESLKETLIEGGFPLKQSTVLA